MDKINKAIRYNSLLKVYGALLSDTQKELTTDYYEYDLSLSEIAENHNISRSAVEDAIKKSIRKLDFFENELHILDSNQNILLLLSEFKEKNDISCLNKIEEIISKYGI